jgi:hypothetical protein
MPTSSDQQMLDLLADPASANFSNHEIARRTNLDHRYIVEFRAPLGATGREPADNGRSDGEAATPAFLWRRAA